MVLFYATSLAGLLYALVRAGGVADGTSVWLLSPMFTILGLLSTELIPLILWPHFVAWPCLFFWWTKPSPLSFIIFGLICTMWHIYMTRLTYAIMMA